MGFISLAIDMRKQQEEGFRTKYDCDVDLNEKAPNLNYHFVHGFGVKVESESLKFDFYNYLKYLANLGGGMGVEPCFLFVAC